jgi:hypothetical protein
MVDFHNEERIIHHRIGEIIPFCHFLVSRKSRPTLLKPLFEASVKNSHIVCPIISENPSSSGYCIHALDVIKYNLLILGHSHFFTSLLKNFKRRKSQR